MISNLPTEHAAPSPTLRPANARRAPLPPMRESRAATLPRGPGQAEWQAYLERPDTRELITRQFCQNLGLTFPAAAVATPPEA